MRKTELEREAGGRVFTSEDEEARRQVQKITLNFGHPCTVCVLYFSLFNIRWKTPGMKDRSAPTLSAGQRALEAEADHIRKEVPMGATEVLEVHLQLMEVPEARLRPTEAHPEAPLMEVTLAVLLMKATRAVEATEVLEAHPLPMEVREALAVRPLMEVPPMEVPLPTTILPMTTHTMRNTKKTTMKRLRRRRRSEKTLVANRQRESGSGLKRLRSGNGRRREEAALLLLPLQGQVRRRVQDLLEVLPAQVTVQAGLPLRLPLPDTLLEAVSELRTTLPTPRPRPEERSTQGGMDTEEDQGEDTIRNRYVQGLVIWPQILHTK